VRVGAGRTGGGKSRPGGKGGRSLSPPLVHESAAISTAREKGWWVRSDERRAAQGLESLYALSTLAPQGPTAADGQITPSGPTSSPSRNSLLQIPAFLGQQGAGGEAMGLYDTGASVSFVEAGFVKRHAIPVHQASHHLKVMNGDGSFQTAQGQVSVLLNIGEFFKEEVTLVVINLDQFDFIVGLPDIMGFGMELRGDPMRIHILGAKKRTVAPAVIGSWEDENGQRRVHVLDESATSLRHWQSQGKADLYHLVEVRGRPCEQEGRQTQSRRSSGERTSWACRLRPRPSV
jgi:hypothetical protein